jgi:hypothetical protein
MKEEIKARWEAMMEACPEKMEATDSEANPEEIRVWVGASGSP